MTSLFEGMLKFGLARLKLIMAGVAFAAVGALILGIEQQFGIAVPNEIKLAITTWLAGMVGNYTPNVAYLPEGFALPASTLPVLAAPKKLPLVSDEEEFEDESVAATAQAAG